MIQTNSSDLNDICRVLSWDSEHFGIGIARLIPESLSKPDLSSALAWCSLNKIECIYALIDPYSRTTTLLSSNGFELIDVRITLTRPVEIALHAREGISDIRIARHEDRMKLKILSHNIKWRSRFTLDKKFNQKSVEEMYSIWVCKSVLSAKDIVFIASVENVDVGFIVCDIADQEGVISLIGVSNKYAGMGIGKDLIAYGLSWFNKQNMINVLRVVTQADNYPALALYERSGFTVSNCQLWYHRWLEEIGGK